MNMENDVVCINIHSNNILKQSSIIFSETIVVLIIKVLPYVKSMVFPVVIPALH